MSTQSRPLGREALRIVLVLVALSTGPGCDATDSAGRSDGLQEREAHGSPGTDVEVEDPAPTGPLPCPAQSASVLTTPDQATRDLPVYGSIGDLVVDAHGTATLAWDDQSGGHGNVRTLDQPSSPADPQVLPGPPQEAAGEGAQVSGHFPVGDHLGVDGAGTLTAMWLQDQRLPNGQNTEYYDVVLSDRPAGGAWSAAPSVAGDGYVGESKLAVNQSGAAVVAWDRFAYGGLYVSYRPRAGAAWSPAEQLAPHAFMEDVGIDDAGRVVVLLSGAEKFMAVRGTPTTGWSRPHPLPGYGGTLAVSAGGEAVVAVSRGARGRNYTIRMSPSGHWDAPVRQPGAVDYGYRTVALDADGRALYVWWDQRRVVTRWSGSAGKWGEPCVLAEGVPDPGYFDEVHSHVAVNPRGDALVMWRTKNPAPHLWARYMPAGQAWTAPIEVTAKASSIPSEFRASLGVRGDAAIAWISKNRRQLNVLRLAPLG